MAWFLEGHFCGPAACTTKKKKKITFVSVSLCFQNIMCHHAWTWLDLGLRHAWTCDVRLNLWRYDLEAILFMSCLLVDWGVHVWRFYLVLRKQEKARGSKRKQEEARERQIRKAGGIRHVQCGKGFVILSLSLLWQDEFTWFRMFGTQFMTR